MCLNVIIIYHIPADNIPCILSAGILIITERDNIKEYGGMVSLCVGLGGFQAEYQCRNNRPKITDTRQFVLFVLTCQQTQPTQLSTR